MDLARCYVCAKEKEEGSKKTSNRKRNGRKKRKTKKEEEDEDEEAEEEGREIKQKQKQKQTRMLKHKLKSNTLLAGRALREKKNGHAVATAWWNSSFLQRSRSWAARRETACQENSIPQNTGKRQTLLNYMM